MPAGILLFDFVINTNFIADGILPENSFNCGNIYNLV